MREWQEDPGSLPKIDVDSARWDAPFARPVAEVSEEAPIHDDPPLDDAYEFYGDEDPYGYYDDEDWDLDEEEDLLETLEEALDEVEHEEHLEAVRERAHPSRDVAEVVPAPETLYRENITRMLGQPARPEAPRYSQIRTRAVPATTNLQALLHDGLRRARNNMEVWRIHGWAHDLPGAFLGQHNG